MPAFQKNLLNKQVRSVRYLTVCWRRTDRKLSETFYNKIVRLAGAQKKIKVTQNLPVEQLAIEFLALNK